MKNRSGLADWLQAIHELKPLDGESRDAITRLLGLRSAEPDELTKPKLSSVEPKVQAKPSIPKPTPPAEGPHIPVESTLIKRSTSGNSAPGWLATAVPLEDTKLAMPIIPLEPLFPSNTTRAILSGALATPSESGLLDLSRVIELVSRAEVLDHVPSLLIPTLVRGAQLLIDQSEAMQPFSADQMILQASLSSVVGRDRTEVLYFEGSPLWGAGTGLREDWSEYKSPGPGTPVVVLTDLGIAQRGDAGFAGVSDWQEFAELIARTGCPLLALVPYPSRRWPLALTRKMTIVQWDRATTVSVIRRIVGFGLRTSQRG